MAAVDQASRALDAVLQGYFRVRRFEANGRIYRWIGVEGLYRKLATMSGERPLGPLDGLTPHDELAVTRADLHRILTGSNYFDFANLVRVSYYLIPFSMAVSLGLWLGVTWGFLLILLHLYMVGVERYKRILCHTYLAQLPEDFVPTHRHQAHTIDEDPRSFSARWFRPWQIESDTLYRRLGVEWFRRFVHFYANRTRIEPGDRNQGKKFQFVEGGGRQSMEAYLHSTRVSESTHVIGMGLNTPFMIPFIVVGHVPGTVLVGLMIVFDFYCAALQRYHRVRAERLQRLKSRKK